MSQYDVQEYYDRFSSSYDREREQGYFAHITDLEFAMIRPLATGRKTLEIGCGTGLILHRTAEIAADAWGVDVSEQMVARCLEKNLHTQVASATELPFPDNSFDLVYSFKVLPHVPDIAQAIGEAFRVVRPAGTLVLEFYNPISFKGLNDRLRRAFRGTDAVYLRHDTMSDVSSYLPAACSVVNARGIRIFGPCAAAYELPGIGPLTRMLDRIACESWLKRFGGYFAVELHKSASPDRVEGRG